MGKKMSDEKSFDVTIDREARIITIQHIQYAFDLFDALAFEKAGTRFEIGERRDGVVELRTFEKSQERSLPTWRCLDGAFPFVHPPFLNYSTQPPAITRPCPLTCGLA